MSKLLIHEAQAYGLIAGDRIDALDLGDVFVFWITPIGKPRMVKSDAWKKRKAVERYWTYKDLLKEMADKVGFEPGKELIIDAYIPMAKSWSKKKKLEMHGQEHDQKPDWDNIGKGIQDCLWGEDSKVFRGIVEKFWAHQEEGRIVIYKTLQAKIKSWN